MSKLKLWKRACGIFLLWASAAVALPAQTLTTLHRFDGTEGADPLAGLVQGTDGNFYGTTVGGGTKNGNGTVFNITVGGTLTTLHSFVRTDGQNPFGGLVQGTDGNFYGTTIQGGANNAGTFFTITPSGTLTTLHSFDGTNGAPFAALIQGTDGGFYGTSAGGGASGFGTVFKITPNGTVKTVHSFDNTDGANPAGGLVQGTDGNFYGTTQGGGASGFGTVFKIASGGTLTTLHSFDKTDGTFPSGLVQSTDGNFYGTMRFGGANGFGTVFAITPSGTLTTLHSFDGTDGENPRAAPIQATDGNFYGTTQFGGANGFGTVFAITPSGTLTTPYNFCSHRRAGICTDGEEPVAALTQGTNGRLFGTAELGGEASQGCNDSRACGTVFALDVGLGQFVETQTSSGAVGAHVKILGTNLTGATSVTFNGTAATFTVFSHSLITTTVPAGATSGTVQVVTPGGTLSSNVPFTVK